MQPRKHFSHAPPPIKISKHSPQPPRPPPFPSTNPSLAHPATSQALFPTTHAHQNFQALFPSGGRLQFSKRCAKCLRPFCWPMQLSSPHLEFHLAIYDQHPKKFSRIVKVPKYFMPRGFATCAAYTAAKPRQFRPRSSLLCAWWPCLSPSTRPRKKTHSPGPRNPRYRGHNAKAGLKCNKQFRGPIGNERFQGPRGNEQFRGPRGGVLSNLEIPW